jgi:branched-chain amino acid transport system permease protein
VIQAPSAIDIAAIGIAILLSYSMAISLRVGLLSVAPAAFTGLAAYSFALLTAKLGWSIFAAGAITVIGAGILGIIVALPLRRIRGVYTSIATIAILVIATGLERSFDFTGGTLGLGGFPYGDTSVLLIIGIVIVAAIWFWLDRSQFGRRIDTAGKDPILAEVFGIRVMWIRFGSIVFGSVIAGYTGIVYAYGYGYITPDSFGFQLAILATAYAVVGGSVHWLGPLIGGLVLGALNTSMFNWGFAGQIITGAIMAAAVIFYPDGVAGTFRKRFRYRRLSRRLMAEALEASQGGPAHSAAPAGPGTLTEKVES